MQPVARLNAADQGMAAPARPRSWLRRLLRWTLLSMAALFLILAGLMSLWAFAPPVSTLMLARYAALRPVERQWVPLERISPQLIAAVIASEDARFCRHAGVDWQAVEEQVSADRGPARGASTIAMQTAKNICLWPGRSYIRKGIEIPLALTIDRLWGKRRVLEVYLNVAEWGPGVFGVEAASRRYFRRSAATLTPRQASLLATALPNPLLRNPAKPSRRHGMLTGINLRRAAAAGPLVNCLAR